MLRERNLGLELLVIRRAENELDPWSGHMALPGGGREPGDESVYDTARRETLEEIGIDLYEGHFLRPKINADAGLAQWWQVMWRMLSDPP
jgi:8-oxo-dGTP pyrophosphatase MutT (NUDIX family)